MDSDRWQRVEHLYLKALEKSPVDRAEFLEQACGTDTALRQEVESLLSFAPGADNLLQAAVREAVSELPGEGPATGVRKQGTTGNIPNLGRYQLIEKIGKGAMGVVYRAMDPAIGRMVAIKTILARDVEGEDSQLRIRLLRESQAAGRLSHPNIVAVHDVCEEGETAYIVMEYVDGRTLEQAMRDESSRLSNAEALRIVEECAAALDYAHGRGVVHRDIKPANIMLQSDGAVKIADFGVAKISQAPALTQSAVAVGSPHYMAPEQWRGEPVTGRADQYALATVAYAMFAGRRPFVGDSVATMAAKTLYEEPPAVTSFNASLNPMVDVVLRKALAKTGAERYATCDEFASALRQAFDGAPAVSPSAGNQMWKIAALVLVSIVILSAGGWLFYRSHLGQNAKPVETAKSVSPPLTETKPTQPPRAIEGATKPVSDPAAAEDDPVARAQASLKEHNFAQAITYFTRAIESKPDYRAYFGRAGAYRQLGQMEEAVADYSQAILLNPDSAAAYHDRALCEIRLGLNKNAADDDDQALRLDPTNPRTWNDRGAIYFKNGGYHKAQEAFTRAIELDNRFAAAYRNRAQAERKLNDAAAAEEDMKKATALEQEEAKQEAH